MCFIITLIKILTSSSTLLIGIVSFQENSCPIALTRRTTFKILEEPRIETADHSVMRRSSVNNRRIGNNFLPYWHYSPMRAFASIMDLLYIPLSLDCSFQFLILHFFMSDNTQFIHRFVGLPLLEYPEADYRICCIPSFPYPSYSHDLSISVCLTW